MLRQNHIALNVSVNCHVPTFGSQMPGRNYTSSNYRYGFNGKENDNEVKGAGNSYDYGFRIYDPRIGKFLSVDPLTKSYPWFTPYQFAANKPINSIDLDGLEDFEVTFQDDLESGSRTTKIRFVKDGDVLNIVYSKMQDGKNVLLNLPSDQFRTEKQKEAGDRLIESNRHPEIIKEHDGHKDAKRLVMIPIKEPITYGSKKVDNKPISKKYEFKGDDDAFIDKDFVEKDLKNIAAKLNADLDAKLEIIPFAVSESVNDVSKKGGTVGGLLKLRGDAVRDILINKYKINPARVSVGTGVADPSGERKVEFQLKTKSTVSDKNKITY